MSEELVGTKSTEYIHKYEGLEVEEAQLTYKQREKLPSTAFCGPNRSYPAHDKKHIKAGLQRLSQFWGKLPPTTRESLFRCLKRRAKKAGIEVSKDWDKRLNKSRINGFMRK